MLPFKIREFIKNEVRSTLKTLNESSPDDSERIQELAKACKRVGLSVNPSSIVKSTTSPNQLEFKYPRLGGAFSIKTFTDIEKLTGGRLSFRFINSELVFYYNY